MNMHRLKRGCVRHRLHIETGFGVPFQNVFPRLRGRARAVTGKCLIVLACLCASSSLGNAAGDGPDFSRRDSPDLCQARSYSHYIVIGFLGGFVAHNEPHHPEIRMIQTLRRDYPGGAYFDLFENKKIDEAYKLIVNRLDVDQDGGLSDEEKRQACIELFGHSWGASAVVSLSRKLGRTGIPVRLTVQVDSVAKPFHNDSVIPANVLEAANFYQTHGLIRGESKIVAADPSRTTILGNFRRDYDHEPEQCRGFSWHARFFTKAHIEIECDPKMWTQVETLLRAQLPQVPAKGAHSDQAELLSVPTHAR
jgi:hypothetical protein